ncbi:MAG: tRNA (guanine(46)-N(7))-methyltransferase TrmB [Leptonema sp. (in: bacteria)]
MEKHLQEKLLKIIQKPAKYKQHPNTIVPEAIIPIPKEILFDQLDSYHILELGCGWGEFALEWLRSRPQDEYIAFEIKKDRIKKLLKKIDAIQLKNLKILIVNFEWFLEEILPKNSFDLIIINFPDPWPKKRHWKHRVIKEENLIKFYELLRNQGKIYIATDYGPYARKIISLFRKSKFFLPLIPFPNYTRTKIKLFPESKFENRISKTKKPYYTLWKKV